MYKIFVVEDEHLESEAIQMIIRQEGKNLEIAGTAASGTEAVEKIHRLRPDIILLDINIPEINGIDVLKIVKKELGIDKIRELLIDLLIKGEEDTGVYDRASALDAIDAYAPELLNGIEKWRA